MPNSNSGNSNSNKNKKLKFSRKQIKWSIFSFLVLMTIVGGFLFFDHVFSGLPSLEQLENPQQSLASNVFSSDGELIGQFFRQNRVEANLDSLPSFLTEALIATEDRKFYDHWGVDVERFIKAMIKNVLFFSREGASTITQQLAKNLYEFKVGYESPFETVVRKVREWITAIQIEKAYTKREILEMYLNESYFGKGAYGIESAAQIYFNKPAKNLTLPEAAVFIALLRSSKYYDPVNYYNNALARRNLVMYNMVDVGYLDRAEYDLLKLEPISLSMENISSRFKINTAPYFVEHVRRQLESLSEKYDFNLYEDGLTIYTTIDTRMQRIANRVTKEHLDEFQKQFDKFWNWKKNRTLLDELLNKAVKQRPEYRSAQTAEEKEAVYDRLIKNVAFVDSVQTEAQKIEVGFVVLNVKNGNIKAMVGGRDQDNGLGLNHVTQIRRQPGSSFKPIIYSVAIDNGLYPAYPLLNQPFIYGEGDNEWSPKNFDNSTGGFTPLRDALKESLNLISARLIIEGYVELWKVGVFASKMGIKSRLNLVPSISLGTSEVNPLELVSVYATLGNHGIYNEPIAVKKIEDKDGILIDVFTSESREAISEETAYIMTNMLQTVIDEGTGIRTRAIHKFMRPAAGKTGTTQDYGDAWFVGYTPQLAGGVWVGFDDRRVSFTGSYGQGSKAANPIWSNFMREVHDSIEIPLEYFEPPLGDNVVTVDFCRETIFELGDPKLYSSDCKSGIYRDIINLKDLPPVYNAERDNIIKIDPRYLAPDSLSHEAIEIK